MDKILEMKICGLGRFDHITPMILMLDNTQQYTTN